MPTGLQQTEPKQDGAIYFLPIPLKGTLLHTSSSSFTFHSCLFAFQTHSANLLPLSFSLLITVLFLLVLPLVTVTSAFSSVLKCSCSMLIFHFHWFNHQFLHGGNEMKIIFNAHNCVTHTLCFFLSLTYDALQVFLYMQETYWSLMSKISSSSKGSWKGEGRMG